jgi:hypothetical protein
MNKKIETYKDLVEQKHKLEALLYAQKQLIRADVEELKLELRPLSGVAAYVKKFTTRDKTALLVSLSSDVLAQGLLKRVVLARSGWLMKTILPYFFRNFSSNFLNEQKDKFVDRLRSMLRHTNGKEQKPASTGPADEQKIT